MTLLAKALVPQGSPFKKRGIGAPRGTFLRKHFENGQQCDKWHLVPMGFTWGLSFAEVFTFFLRQTVVPCQNLEFVYDD